MTLSLAPEPDITLEEKALSIPDQVKTLFITNPESYILMAELRERIKALRKEVADTFDKPINDAYLHHKDLIARKEKHDLPLRTGEIEAKRRLEAYDAEQKRIADAEAARLREIERKAEEERIMQEALQAEQEGDHETAEAIIQEEVYVPPVTVVKATPKVSGVVFRTYWKWRVKKLALIPRQYLIPNEVLINSLVTHNKNKEQSEQMIPGIEVWSERS